MEHPLWLRILKSRLWIGAYVLTAIVAGVVVWFVGHRGIFFYDQSGIFDGAWRILQGQVIYRDFYVPYGPVIFSYCPGSFALPEWIFLRWCYPRPL
jgi:hypothetical protein